MRKPHCYHPPAMLTIEVDHEIQLRTPLIGDAEALFALIEQNRQHLAEWLGYIGNIRSVEDAERFIANRQQEAQEESSFEFLVEYQGSIVGRIWISKLAEEESRADLSYWLAENAVGQGIMTRSCRVAMRWLFEERKVNRVEIFAARPNKKSQAVPARLGFTFEGYLRDGTLVNGEHYDEAVYSMLAREWPDKSG